MLLATGEGVTPLELDSADEERLDAEWGISRIGSQDGYASDFSVGDVPRDMTGVGVKGIARSETGLLDLERERAEEAEPDQAGSRLARRGDDGDGDEEELLETKSMPDLSRPRRISFADLILGEVDERLAKGSTALTPDEEHELKDRAEEMLRQASDGPRIKVIERTATQRRTRLRTRTLSTNFAFDLPHLPDPLAAGSEAAIARDGASMTPSGKARGDSLFNRPGSAAAFSSTRHREISSVSRALTDGQSLSSEVMLFQPSSPSPGALSSAQFRTAPHDDPDSDERDPFRPASALSITPTVFTSRFDPNYIRVQREQQLAERPVFTNPDAGRPPNVVLMPAPLAGQLTIPSRKPRVEGPSGEDGGEEGEGDEEEEEAEEEEEEEQKPQRPAGALYGRSLMDVMAERKAMMKAQQRAYLPGSDGRRGMMDWKDSPAAQETLAARGALAKLEGRSMEGEEDDDSEEEVPLALLPAGGALRKKAQEEKQAATKPQMSIFGPDLLYQRELAAAKKAEEAERLEREEHERHEKEVEARRLAKEERKRLKRKSGAKVLEYRDLVDRQLVSGEFKTPADLLRESQRANAPPPLALTQEDLPSRFRSNTPAPSISIPSALAAHLNDDSDPTTDWFELTAEVPSSEDQVPDKDDPNYRPRTLSGGLLQQNGRSSAFFGSESGSEEEADVGRGADTSPTAARRQIPAEISFDNTVLSPSSANHRLALPGEPSSQGHGVDVNNGEDEDEDEAPLGRRYSRQSLGMFSPAKGTTSDDEDDRPLAQRYSRQSLMLASPTANLSPLKLNLPKDEPLASFGNQPAEDEEDEDERPLGQRYSTIRPVDADDDDVPLALRRMSLAPLSGQMTSPFAARNQAYAKITALEGDGDDEVEVIGGAKSVGGDSDDVPLGLRQGAPPTLQQMPPNPSMFFPPSQPFYGAPFAGSQFFVPPPVMHPAMMAGAGPSADASMQFALAQMQMQAAAAMSGPAEGIENWRRGVAS
ncbi:hypothetical protein JCM10212_006926 [Sporobolomyces blumeae]